MTEQNLNAKQKYRLLCEQEPSIPIFSKAWWLDAVAGDSWDVVLVENNNGILASLPFVIKKRFGLTILTQPKLTQTLGPWLRPSTAKYAKQLAQEKDLLQALFDQLPPHAYYGQNWHHTRTNWLPLYWKGYQQTTRYTYRINDLSDLDTIYSNFENNSKKNIKNAIEKYGLIVIEDCPLDDFLELNDMVFKRQNKATPYSRDFVRKLDKSLLKNKARKIFIACDQDGRKHGAMYLIWDKFSAYALMGGSNPVLRESGAISLCRWEAIKFAATVTKSFDFEGSMLEGVERSYRCFATVQTPYFAVSKTNSKLLQVYWFLQSLRK